MNGLEPTWRPLDYITPSGAVFQCGSVETDCSIEFSQPSRAAKRRRSHTQGCHTAQHHRAKMATEFVCKQLKFKRNCIFVPFFSRRLTTAQHTAWGTTPPPNTKCLDSVILVRYSSCISYLYSRFRCIIPKRRPLLHGIFPHLDADTGIVCQNTSKLL